MAEIKNAKEAVLVANDFLEEIFSGLYLITKVISDKNLWIIEGSAMGYKFAVKIDKSKGDVIEYTPIEK